jgi:hypothetical protein
MVVSKQSGGVRTCRRHYRVRSRRGPCEPWWAAWMVWTSVFVLPGAIDGLQMAEWCGSRCCGVAGSSLPGRCRHARAALRSSEICQAFDMASVRQAQPTSYLPPTAMLLVQPRNPSNDALGQDAHASTSACSFVDLEVLRRDATATASIPLVGARCLHWLVSAHPRPLAASRISTIGFCYCCL